VNNKRVEAEVRKMFGEDVFLQRRHWTWQVYKRERPDESRAIGCSCCRGNRIIGSGGSPKEALQDAIDSKNGRERREDIARAKGNARIPTGGW